MSAILTKSIVKRFGEIIAVDGVDLEVQEGECFGLLGPNGAGKTTLVKMITAVLPITEGKAWLAGIDVTQNPRQAKANIGVVPQEINLDPDLTVIQNLVVFARYFDIGRAEAKERASANLDFFELRAKEKAKISELSGGMKRRLLIARAIINEPQILVLDEPTVGLDPQTKRMVWQKLISLKEQGVTQLLCTQNMEEAAVLCDRLAIMNEGRIAALGTPGKMISEYGGSWIVEAKFDPKEIPSLEAELSSLGVYWQKLGDTIYIFEPNGVNIESILAERLLVVSRRVPSLEDVFLRLTGRSLQE
ncbi:MAG: ATP-binding cassette domain-containing protein [Chloroflexota bacterium]|nr:ATP-binding cassette domain-containing protein [Chloroflexota bacterium]